MNNRSTVLFPLVLAGVFAFFLTIGFVVRQTPIAVQVFAPSPISLFQLGILSVVLGLFTGMVLSYERRRIDKIVEIFLNTLAAGTAFSIGIEGLVPYALPGVVVVMYAVSYVLTTAILELMHKREESEAESTFEGA